MTCRRNSQLSPWRADREEEDWHDAYHRDWPRWAEMWTEDERDPKASGILLGQEVTMTSADFIAEVHSQADAAWKEHLATLSSPSQITEADALATFCEVRERVREEWGT